MRVAILIEDNYEDLELQYPRLRLREEGFRWSLWVPDAANTKESMDTHKGGRHL